ncbi:hypothetical protein BD779DRAFT_1481840, partial [Infundibulicybe gibba]
MSLAPNFRAHAHYSVAPARHYPLNKYTKKYLQISVIADPDRFAEDVIRSLITLFQTVAQDYIYVFPCVIAALDYIRVFGAPANTSSSGDAEPTSQYPRPGQEQPAQGICADGESDEPRGKRGKMSETRGAGAGGRNVLGVWEALKAGGEAVGAAERRERICERVEKTMLLCWARNRDCSRVTFRGKDELADVSNLSVRVCTRRRGGS